MSEIKRILYLDDEENNLFAFKALFRRDYEIFTTTSPQEAVRYLNENEVQVILSDQKMPEISGVEFFELTITDYPDAVRVLVTGYADIEAVIDAINKGQVYRYVTKPWDENDLRICIENSFDRYFSKIEIKRKNAELQELNDQLQKFIYSASHDMRAPLASIKGVLKVAVSEELSQKAREYFSLIEKSANRLDDYVQNIIHYYQNAQTETSIKPVDLKAMAESLVTQYQGFDVLEKFSIDLEVLSSTPFYTDEYRWRIILGNLLSNAIRYRDQAKSQGIIKINIIQNSEKAVMRFEENGVGMTADTLAQVRDMLQGSERKTLGSGLGLYLIREAVRRLSGSIKMDSTQGEGVAVTLEIPNLQ